MQRKYVLYLGQSSKNHSKYKQFSDELQTKLQFGCTFADHENFSGQLCKHEMTVGNSLNGLNVFEFSYIDSKTKCCVFKNEHLSSAYDPTLLLQDPFLL